MQTRGGQSGTSFPRIQHPPRIYPNPTGNPFVKESFYLSSPKNLFGFAPRGFFVACPPYRSEESKKTWRSRIDERISSDSSFVSKFVAAVDEMQVRAEEYRKGAWGA
jgi:hypothetical protein